MFGSWLSQWFGRRPKTVRNAARARRRAKARTRRPGMEQLEDRVVLSTYLVEDINTGTNGSNPSAPVNANNIVLFAASDGINGTELWRTDGTDTGTSLVKDIVAGTSSSSPSELTNVNGTWF